MRPIDPLSQGEEPGMKRVEDILRSAADFQPETEATYNFAAAAMSRRRFRSRAVWMAAAGCACTALLVWVAMPKGPANITLLGPVMSAPSGTNLTADNDSSADTGTAVHSSLSVRPGSILDPFRPRMSAKRPENMLASDQRIVEPEPAEKAVPKAKWETETVDRYASSVLKPTYVEKQNADGSRTLTPAIISIPVESGERPASEDSNGMGMVSLANYEGETTK